MNNIKDLISKAKKFYDNKNFFDAKTCLLQALKSNEIDRKGELSLHYLIADICYKINDFNDAEKYLLKYIEFGNTNSKIFNFLGNIYLKKRNYKESEKFYIKAIDLDDKNENALVNLAILYQNLGKQKLAASFYKKIIEKNPKNIGALYNLSNIDKKIISDKKILLLSNLMKEKDLTDFDLASSYFLLAENEKNKKNFNEEINFLEKANDYSFKVNENIKKQSNEYWLKVIPYKFKRINYVKKEKSNALAENIFPIFIVGLPRCGSTLIESIISSGKIKVENLGETNLVNWAFINTNRDILGKITDENKKKKN